MLQIGQIVYINHIIGQALFDSANLPRSFKDTLTKLSKYGNNPAKIVGLKTATDCYIVTLKVEESYNSGSVPAVMCGAYNGGQNTECYFETVEQANFIFTQGDTVSFLNLSPDEIEAMQLVRLIYNNKNLVIMPAGDINRIEDHHGIIGRSVSLIRQYEEGPIKLETISQLMANKHFLKLNIRGLRGH